MLKTANSWRRWFAVLFLAVAFAMLTWGQTFLKPYLIGNVLLAYWLVFLCFTSTTVVIGLLDFFAMRRFFKSEQQRIQRYLQREAALRKETKSSPSATVPSPPATGNGSAPSQRPASGQ